MVRVGSTIFFIGCLLAGVTSRSQNPEIDSLKLATSKIEGIDKFAPLINLVRACAPLDNRIALKYAKEARILAFQFGDSSKIVMSSRIIGQLFVRMSMYNEANRILSETMPIALRINSKSDYKLMLSNLAIVCTYSARYSEALILNFQALALRESDKEYEEASLLLNNIGVLYFKLDHLDKAIQFYKDAIKLKSKIHDNYDLDRLLINTGLCYIQLKDFSNGVKCLRRAFQVCDGSCSDAIIIEGEFGLGMSCYEERDYVNAKRHFRTSFLKSQIVGNNRFYVENLTLFSKIFVIEKKYDSALICLLKSEQISSQLNYNELRLETYSIFASYYQKINDLKNNVSYRNKQIALKDSLYNEALTQNLMVVQAEYEQRTNKATLVAQKRILMLKENMISNQRLLIIFSAMAILLLAVLIMMFYKINKRNRNAGFLLEQRIKNRTSELQLSHESLHQSYAAQRHLMIKARNDINSLLSTLSGMSLVLSKQKSGALGLELVIYARRISQLINKIDL